MKAIITSWEAEYPAMQNKATVTLTLEVFGKSMADIKGFVDGVTTGEKLHTLGLQGSVNTQKRTVRPQRCYSFEE